MSGDGRHHLVCDVLYIGLLLSCKFIEEAPSIARVCDLYFTELAALGKSERILIL